MKIEQTKSTISGREESTIAAGRRKSPLFWTALLLVVVLVFIFWRAFLPQYVIFSNDGPYGAMLAEHTLMPSTIRGVWANLNWFGNEGLTPPPSVSSLMRIIMPPLLYSKFLCPVALLIAGIGASF